MDGPVELHMLQMQDKIVPGGCRHDLLCCLGQQQHTRTISKSESQQGHGHTAAMPQAVFAPPVFQMR
eukprot:357881-Chlamydomonas_euryale.AAC.18